MHIHQRMCEAKPIRDAKVDPCQEGWGLWILVFIVYSGGSFCLQFASLCCGSSLKDKRINS